MYITCRYATVVASVNELEDLVSAVRAELREIALDGDKLKSEVFLPPDAPARRDYVMKHDLLRACVKHHLPADDDIIECVRRIMLQYTYYLLAKRFSGILY